MPEELDLPELPESIRGLWDVFLELHMARTPGAMGMGPLTYHDLDAYQRVTSLELTPWEVQTILCVDRAALAVVNDPASSKRTD